MHFASEQQAVVHGPEHSDQVLRRNLDVTARLHAARASLSALDAACSCAATSIPASGDALIIGAGAMITLDHALWCLDQALHTLGDALWCLDHAQVSLGWSSRRSSRWWEHRWSSSSGRQASAVYGDGEGTRHTPDHPTHIFSRPNSHLLTLPRHGEPQEPSLSSQFYGASVPDARAACATKCKPQLLL